MKAEYRVITAGELAPKLDERGKYLFVSVEAASMEKALASECKIFANDWAKKHPDIVPFRRISIERWGNPVRSPEEKNNNAVVTFRLQAGSAGIQKPVGFIVDRTKVGKINA